MASDSEWVPVPLGLSDDAIDRIVATLKKSRLKLNRNELGKELLSNYLFFWGERRAYSKSAQRTRTAIDQKVTRLTKHMTRAKRTFSRNIPANYTKTPVEKHFYHHLNRSKEPPLPKQKRKKKVEPLSPERLHLIWGK